MLNANMNRKITLSILMMLVLICGLSGISYGEDAITISNVTCKASGDFIIEFVTVKGTIRANRDVKNVRGWLTINGQRIGPGGLPVIPELGYTGGRSLGNLSAGQTKSFSITERVIAVSDGDRCGVYFEFKEVDPPPETDPTPAQQPEARDTQSKVCQVGDVLSPGESCTDPGTDDLFSVLDDGRGRYLFITAGTGITLTATINGKKRNFIASKRPDGKWEIKSVTGGGDSQPEAPQQPETGDNQQPDPPKKPDLIITSVRVSNSTLAPGESFTLSATLKNQGTGESTATTLRYYRSIDNIISSDDTEVGSDSVNMLGANRMRTESIRLTAPTAPGTYYYGACVDNLTNESDTDNNCSSTVKITVKPRSDLAIESLQTSDSMLVPGKSFTLSGIVRNSGKGESLPTTLRYYRSTDEDVSAADTEVSKTTVPVLASDATSDVSIVLMAPTTPGIYYYGACIDRIANESNTANNCSAAIKITVGVETEVLIAESQRPPLYWVDTRAGTLHGLIGAKIEDLLTSVQNATSLAVDMVNGKLYWAEKTSDRTGKIRRANFDGSDVTLVKDLTSVPLDIALDIVKDELYVTNSWGKLQRMNLDGSNFQPNLITGLQSPKHLTLDVTRGKIYWTEQTSDMTGKIRRANLDGSNVELVKDLTSVPQGLAADLMNSRLYATNSWGKIQHLGFDGSNFVPNFITDLMSPQEIAVDTIGGKLYWAEIGKIRRANLDGSNVEDVVSGLYNPEGITLDIPSQAIPPTPDPTPDLVVEAVTAEPATVAPGETFRLYATLKNSGTGESTATTLRYYRSTDAVISTEDTQLSSAQRDPLAVNATIRRYLRVTAPTTPGTYYYGVCVDSVSDESDAANNCSIAVSVTVTAPPLVSEDVNEDGVVDVQDLVYVAQQYGQTGTTTADVNDDGVVNIDDLILVAAVLDADAAAAPSLHSGAVDLFTVEDVKLWLSQAQQRDLMDPSVQRGILFLEQLLASMVPKETALLANYPNPFNPETWIPYQLSKSADVTLTIYAVNGQMVRWLTLGHQPAGMYQNRSRAAYWDGKNAFGESVASGVYFYTLTAGDFTATRKMLIRK